jgi:hypothetical protein
VRCHVVEVVRLGIDVLMVVPDARVLAGHSRLSYAAAAIDRIQL